MLDIKFKTLLMDVLHVRNEYALTLNIVVTIISAILGHFFNMFTNHQNAFFAIISVVSLDWLFGSMLAYKKGIFETSKSIKVIYYLVTYFLFLAVCINIENGFDIKWLMEAIMIPILVGTLLSAIKNASLLGVLPIGILLSILENIDSYKKGLSRTIKTTENGENTSSSEDDSSDENS